MLDARIQSFVGLSFVELLFGKIDWTSTRFHFAYMFPFCGLAVPRVIQNIYVKMTGLLTIAFTHTMQEHIGIVERPIYSLENTNSIRFELGFG